MSSITIRAASQPHRMAGAIHDPERQPLLARPSSIASDASDLSSESDLSEVLAHWDHDHIGNQMRRYNVPHQMVRSWVPAPLVPERAARNHPALPPFAVTPADSLRGAAITGGTQAILGTLFAAGAIDFFFADGPSLTNPSGQYNPGLGGACVVAAILGYSVVGAALGNVWYNALLSMTARHHAVIARNPVAAEGTAAAFAIATGLACIVGAVALGADLQRRLHDAPPDGPAPVNAVYEYTLAMLAVLAGPYASGSSNWYFGQLIGAAFVDGLDFGTDEDEDLFTQEEAARNLSVRQRAHQAFSRSRL